MIDHIEQDARQAELDRLYEADGRHDPAHPQHSLYTGLVAGATTARESADRPLWVRMAETYYEAPDDPEEWAAVLDVVADWLAARKPVHGGAVVALRVQARRAREGQ